MDFIMNKNEIEGLLNNYSFNEYKWINAKNIKVANWVRMKCTYGCPDYGKAVCPPNTPAVEQCREFINEYQDVIIIRFSFEADKNNYPKIFSDEITNKLLKLESEIFLKGYYKVFTLNQNCCILCNECAKTKVDCKNPKSSRPSPEAFAVDVYATVRSVGFPINVVGREKQIINRYAFVLVE